jgi:uncharacterized protein YegJ (DUF2314 family)
MAKQKDKKRNHLSRTERRKADKDISKIRNVLKQHDQKLLGKIKYLDSRGDVRIYVDVVMGKVMQHFWMDSVRLKVGHIINGSFVAEKDNIFLLV